jgi:hypothetical protein
MKKNYFLISFLLLFGLSAFAQDKDKCGSHMDLEQIKETDSRLYENIQRLEEHIIRVKDALENPHYDGERIKNAGSTIIVPVVVHILHGKGEEIGTGLNISDDQVFSQMAVLNEDFSRTNGDAVSIPAVYAPRAGSPNIQFRLACIDPRGNSTSGIMRYEVENPNFSVVIKSRTEIDEQATGIKFSALGGVDAWPTKKYLNIWVSDIGSFILGYSPFPSSFASQPNTDGVVISTTAFGRVGNVIAPFNLGRTATHEIGHWLNVFHVDGDAPCGDDFCADTPTQSVLNFGCPTFPHVTCNNGPSGDMFMNFMDYVNDNCMNTFTNDQITRMRATFLGGERAAMIDEFFKLSSTPIFICKTTKFDVWNPTCEPITWQVSGPIKKVNATYNSITVVPFGNGTATITATSGSGSYVSTHTFNVGGQISGTYGTLGTTNVLGTINSVQQNQNYTVNINCTGATNFVWNLVSGNASFASNNNGTQLDLNLGTSNSATFVATTIGSCGPVSLNVTFVAGGHWVSSIFPNPTDTDALVKLYKVDMDSDADYPAFDVRIFNKFNQLMKETHVEQGIGELRLDVADFPTDVYTVQIETEGEVTTTQLVKIN